MILILGDGYIGNKFLDYHGKEANICDVHGMTDEELIGLVNDHEVIINCVGKAGKPNIDWCEDHKKDTIDANVIFPYKLAKMCVSDNKYMVHIGSGCVYDGRTYSETDIPTLDGKSFYSKTKIMSQELLSVFGNVLHLRIRMPIDLDDNPRNLLNKLLKYKKILSIENSITVIPDFLKVADGLIKMRSCGLFNIVNPCPITHDKILDLYTDATGTELHYENLTYAELEGMAKAPRTNCVLSITKLRSVGQDMPNTEMSLVKLFSKLKKGVK